MINTLATTTAYQVRNDPRFQANNTPTFRELFRTRSTRRLIDSTPLANERHGYMVS